MVNGQLLASAIREEDEKPEWLGKLKKVAAVIQSTLEELAREEECLVWPNSIA